jgi:hypothetical protein
MFRQQSSNCFTFNLSIEFQCEVILLKTAHLAVINALSRFTPHLYTALEMCIFARIKYILHDQIKAKHLADSVYAAN